MEEVGVFDFAGELRRACWNDGRAHIDLEEWAI